MTPIPDPRALLRRMFDAAVDAARPAHVVGAALHARLPQPPRGRLWVVGAGKASAEMALALETHWQARHGLLPRGLVVTRYGHEAPCRGIEVATAAHPVPDAAGEAAARRLLASVQGLGPDDVVVALISGGGSSLLPLALPGLTLADLQSLGGALLRCGATIGEINVVRRHLSAIQGGRLGAACHPARVVTLAISDVPGDDPRDIASGPTVGDASTCADALAILDRYRIEPTPPVRAVLESGRGESVQPDDPRLAGATVDLVATPQRSLEAAAELARQVGIDAHILGDAIEGEARDVGRTLAGLARQVARRGQPFRRPCVLLSGGETTVTVRGKGRGGRNVECLLAQTIALGDEPGVWALSADTDGVDGQEEIAGAVATPDTLARAWALGLQPRMSLDDNDGHGFFGALGDSLVTGPTRTNVNDFRAILLT